MLEDSVPLWYNVKSAESPFTSDTVGFLLDMICNTIANDQGNISESGVKTEPFNLTGADINHFFAVCSCFGQEYFVVMSLYQTVL